MKSFSHQRTRTRGLCLEVVQLEDRNTPSSGIEYPIGMPISPYGSPTPDGLLTPPAIRQAYGFNSLLDFGGQSADGTGQTIAIVDAYNTPTITSDLQSFDNYFGIAAPPSFKIVNQNGGSSLPGTDPNDDWPGETSLDVEYAHAMAPGANIILVEADSAADTDLYTAARTAAGEPGVSVITDSWGGGESSSDVSSNSNWTTPTGHQGVTFLFSAGDSGVVSYPSSSPNVLSVGATDLYLNGSGGYGSETGWYYPDSSGGGGGGGGKSQYESIPSFQAGIPSVASVVGTTRGTPDVSIVGGDQTPVAVYNTYDNPPSDPWEGVYGTSASSPMWAGIIAIINQGRVANGSTTLDGPSQTLPKLYALYNNPTTYAADFHDINDPSGGANYYGNKTGPGYDLLTGIGSPIVNKLVPDMVGSALKTTLVATPNNLPTGGEVTLTLTLTGGTAAPTGTVDFTVGARDLGTAPVVNGVATLMTSAFGKGTSTVTGTYSGDINYPSSSATTTVTFGIGGSTTTVTGPITTVTYGQSVPLTVDITGIGTSTPTGSVDVMYGTTDLGSTQLVGGMATVSVTQLPAGTITFTVTYSGDTNYSMSSGTVVVTVNPAPLQVTANSLTFVYGGVATLPALTFGPPVGLQYSDTAQTVLSGALTTTATPTSGVGTYTINQGSLISSSNYTLTFVSANLTITAASLTVTLDNESFVYGGTFPKLTYEPPVGLVNGDTAAALLNGVVTTTATSTSGVGDYPITVMTQGGPAGLNNYTLTVVPATLTITPAPLTITADSQSLVYGGTFPQLTYESPVGLVNGDIAAAVLIGSLSTPATPTSGVGSYPITQGALSAGANYTLKVVPATLTITPAPLTVVANSQKVVYGSFPSTLTYVPEGLVNGDTATSALTGQLATTATQNSNVGTYPITAGTLAATSNYTLTIEPAKLTITPAKLTITANNVEIQNDGAVPTLTYTVSGLVNGNFASVVSGVVLSTPTTSFTPVGVYPITVSGGKATNYTLTDVGGTLTITASSRLVGTSQYVVGSNDGSGTAIVYNADGSVATTITPFPGFTGAIRAVVADFSGNGTPDYIFGTGPGTLAQVLVLNGQTLQPLFSVLPFQGFTGGVFVAAGDIAGNGTGDDLVVTPDQGGGPRVEIYQYGDGTPIANFYGINDPNFRGGARAALGDLTHDGHADLVVAAGYGGGARISVYSGAALAQGQLVHPIGDFFAFPNVIRNGVYVAIGDVNGDGYGDIIVGAGPGGGPNVEVLSGYTLLTQGAVAAIANPIANFIAGDPNNRDGVTVAAKDIVGSGNADVVTGEGGGGSLVAVYGGSSLAAGNLNPLYTVDPFQGSLGGVYVG